MTSLGNTIRELERQLDTAIAMEEKLVAILHRQEQALIQGRSEQIHDTNRQLAAIHDDLVRVSATCRKTLDEIDRRLGLPADAPLGRMIAALPHDLDNGLGARRERLLAARAGARAQTLRNVSIATTSLDAVASVRGILSRAMEQGDPTSSTREPLARLDTRV